MPVTNAMEGNITATCGQCRLTDTGECHGSEAVLLIAPWCGVAKGCLEQLGAVYRKAAVLRIQTCGINWFSTCTLYSE